MEKHLIIIWENGLFKKNEILLELSKSYEIIFEDYFSWEKENFSKNISRFYSTNLKDVKHKVRHCGNGPFYLVIILDRNPKYDLRKTSKGYCYLNSNIFDEKLKLRKMTGGGHKIHATNNSEEYYLDVKKLFGVNWNIFENKISTQSVILVKDNIPSKWDTLEDLFNFIGDSIKYVILRNYDNLEEQIFDSKSIHPDIDILTDNPQVLVDLIGAVKTSKIKYRKQYYIYIANKKVLLDIRGTNENYYCFKFSNRILENREKFKSFYIPDTKDYFYSLIYHCLIHKESVSHDYLNKIHNLSNSMKINLNFNLSDDLFKSLIHFLNKKNYEIVEPLDLSVFYNYKLIKNYYPIDISSNRKRYNNYLTIKYGIFKIFKKIIGAKLAKKIKNFFG